MILEVKSVIRSILTACAEISDTIKNSPVYHLHTSNAFGDKQLHLDVETDLIVEKWLKTNPEITHISSEERPEYMQINNGSGFWVTYDPLDGSSIIDNNFTVGSIFSIWPNNTDPKRVFLSSQLAAIFVMYGPRTTAIIAYKDSETVQEFTLMESKWIIKHKQETNLVEIELVDGISERKWIMTQDDLKIAAKAKIFSPGNLRATTERKSYRECVDKWINEGLTLRYTGGLVPDIYQLLIKGNGIFANISSSSHKAKLRILYEVAAVALLVHKAGGTSYVPLNKQSLMEVECTSLDARIEFICGSVNEVEDIANLLASKE